MQRWRVWIESDHGVVKGLRVTTYPKTAEGRDNAERLVSALRQVASMLEKAIEDANREDRDAGQPETVPEAESATPPEPDSQGG